MLAWAKGGFTCADGTMDDARVAAMLLVLAYVGLAATATVMSEAHLFDAQQFGIGAGALAAGIGVWFGQRKDN